MHLFRKKKTLVTHNSKFHADDIFACATLQLVLERRGELYKVIRTRDKDTIATADFVFDLGGEYDHEKKRYDHHQKGGAGERDNGVPYAAFGLVWKHYGEVLCGSVEIADILDKKLVQPIDAEDNGMKIMELVHEDVVPRTLQGVLYAFRPTWKEGFTDEQYDKRFLEQVDFAKKLIMREIQVIIDNLPVKDFIKEAYNKASDKRIIIFEGSYPWEPFMDEYPEVVYVIFPRSDTWRVGAVPQGKFSFELRKPLPQSWGGLRDEDLVRETGVSGAVFCHNARFLAVATSLEGAQKLAQLALEHHE
jgi:uncharacterized UPF0160 family protein